MNISHICCALLFLFLKLLAIVDITFIQTLHLRVFTTQVVIIKQLNNMKIEY